MLYRLFTTTEDRTFSDFMTLLDHLEKNYPVIRTQFFTTSNKNPAYHIYNAETDERLGYYEII